MGSGAWVKQLFYGITAATTAPQPCWIDYVNAAYDRGLKPVIRLAGVARRLFLAQAPARWAGQLHEHRPGVCTRGGAVAAARLGTR